MSLKELRKKATQGPRATCPACGKNLSVFELTSGQHAASCAGVRQAVQDANNATVQKRLRQEHDQSKFVMKRQTWSERHFDLLGESNFIRQYWAPSMVSLMLLSFAIGWGSPQGSGELALITNISIGPGIFLGGTWLMFKGKLAWIHNPFRRK